MFVLRSKAHWLLFLLLLAGCSTHQTIQNVDRPVRELQKISELSMPNGLASVSKNGREFTSKYFTNKKGTWDEYKGEKIRYFARIIVLGDRRPYVLSVAVYSQNRLGEKSYSQEKYIESMSRVLKRRVEKSVHRTGLDRNIIDDFKVF